MSEVPFEEARGPGFRADLAAAFRVWRTRPMLPLLSCALWGAFLLIGLSPSETGLVPFVGLALFALAAAWPGVERVWYLRAFRGRTVEPREIRRLVTAFFGRYAVLGLVFFAPVVGLYIVLYQVSPGLAHVLIPVSVIPIDLALTFVTPALAFTTRRVREAIAIGFRMIREEWPRCAMYVAVPPLAVLALSSMWWRTLAGPVGARVLGLATTLASLALKGATAAFYLRSRPCGDDGAAYASRRALTPQTEREPA